METFENDKPPTEDVFADLRFDVDRTVIETYLASLNYPLASTITPQPSMTPTDVRLTIQHPYMALPGVVTAYAEYTDHGRSDRCQTLTINATSPDGSFTINWGPIIQGSHIVYDRSMVVRHIPSGQTKTYVYHATKGDIRGQNPSPTMVKARLGAIEHQVIAYKESRWRQFGPDGLPFFGPPNGFGIMQLDNSPVPTARQIWDWTQNVDGGVAKYEAGKGTVLQHYRNIQHAHPGVPDLTPDQFRRAAYQYYNSGNNFYCILNATSTNWVKNPNVAFTRYGDEAAQIEDLVRAGSPPPDWN